MGWILLVDDETEIRETTAELLRDEGYEVIEAPDGQRALDCLLMARERPSLVLLDLMMPKMRGEALLEMLGDLGLLADLDVVAVTADGTTRVRGAQRVLHKPFSLSALLDLVADYCPPPTLRAPPTAPPPPLPWGA